MKNLNIALLLIFAGIVAAACSGNKQSGEEAPKVVELIGKNPDNQSIYLSITDRTEQDTNYIYTVKGQFDGDTVGFQVSIDKHIPAGINLDGSVNEADGFKTGNIKFLRSGEESDRFIQVLARIWELDPASSTFSGEAVLPLVFSSNNKEVDFSKPSTNNFKLFFDPEAEEPGEIFFTLDTYYQQIELQEKDSVYRQTIFNALGGVEIPVPVEE